MYAKPINRLHLTTPIWKTKPHIRVLWFTLLMHRDSRGYIDALIKDIQQLSELPTNLYNDAMEYLLGESDNNNNKYIILTEKGIKLNCLDKIDRDKISNLPKWKEKSAEGFEEYIKMTEIGFKEIMRDYNFLLELKEFFPNAHISRSIQRAFSTYWGTEKAWLKRIKKRSNVINWKTTISNTIQYNLVQLRSNEDYEKNYFEKKLKDEIMNNAK